MKMNGLCLKNTNHGDILPYFSACQSNRNFANVEFICQNGKANGHLFYLSNISKYLQSLFRAQRKEGKVIIMLPDFEVETVRLFLAFVYSGSIDAYGSRKEFFSLARILGVPTKDILISTNVKLEAPASPETPKLESSDESDDNELPEDHPYDPLTEFEEIDLISDEDVILSSEDEALNSTALKRSSMDCFGDEEPKEKRTKTDENEMNMTEDSVISLPEPPSTIREDAETPEPPSVMTDVTELPACYKCNFKVRTRPSNLMRHVLKHFKDEFITIAEEQSFECCGITFNPEKNNKFSEHYGLGSHNYLFNLIPKDFLERVQRFNGNKTGKQRKNMKLSKENKSSKKQERRNEKKVISDKNATLLPKCLHCNAREVTKGKLLRHIVLRHYLDEFRALAKDKGYECCGKVYRSMHFINYCFHVGLGHKHIYTYLPSDFVKKLDEGEMDTNQSPLPDESAEHAKKQSTTVTMKQTNKTKKPCEQTPRENSENNDSITDSILPVCIYCGIKKGQRTELLEHLITEHHVEDFRRTAVKKGWICCNMEFPSNELAAFALHYGIVHRTIFSLLPKEFSSEIKVRPKTTTRSSREYPCASRKETRKDIPSCYDCGKKFDTLSKILRHMCEVHLSEKYKDEFEKNCGSCTFCKKIFKNRKVFAHHVGAVHRTIYDHIPDDMSSKLRAIWPVSKLEDQKRKAKTSKERKLDVASKDTGNQELGKDKDSISEQNEDRNGTKADGRELSINIEDIIADGNDKMKSRDESGHSALSVPSSDDCPVCKKCGFYFPSTKEVFIHMLTDHYKSALDQIFSEKSGICPFCPEDLTGFFEDVTCFNKHLLDDHDPILILSLCIPQKELEYLTT